MLDLIIVGSSAAGSAAGIWAARRNLNFKIIALDTEGEVALSGEVSNYPGIIETNGFDLAKKFKEHLDYYKVNIQVDSEVKEIKKEGDVFIISGIQFGKPFEEKSKTVILATGSKPKHLNVPGEKEFYHKGVSYCTVCDGPLFKDKIVATIGGGNSALESAIMLSALAKKVYLINKNPKFKGEAMLIEKIEKLSNIEIINEALIQEIKGGNFVEKLIYKDKNGKMNELGVDGIFVHIGMLPNSQMAPQDVKKNDLGEIEINTKCETSLLGLFAAGDVTNVPYKQIAIAVGQGACAALSAISYLNSH